MKMWKVQNNGCKGMRIAHMASKAKLAKNEFHKCTGGSATACKFCLIPSMSYSAVRAKVNFVPKVRI